MLTRIDFTGNGSAEWALGTVEAGGDLLVTWLLLPGLFRLSGRRCSNVL